MRALLQQGAKGGHPLHGLVGQGIAAGLVFADLEQELDLGVFG